MSGSHLTKLSLALALIGLAVAGSIARAETQEDMARDLVPAQKPLYQLGGVSPEAGQGVDAWVDRPDLHYRIGQQLRVFVRPRRTSYITVLNVGTSGRVSVIFPNFYQRESRVRAGGTVAIPSETSGWSINVAGPPASSSSRSLPRASLSTSWSCSGWRARPRTSRCCRSAALARSWRAISSRS